MILRGKTISPGVARGAAQVMNAPAILAVALQIEPAGTPQGEIERLNAAIGRAGVQLDRLGRQLSGRLPRQDVGIFDAHASLLRDFKFIAQIELEIHENRLSAEAAVATVVRRLYAQFRGSSVTLAQDKAADILDIGRRLVQCLSPSSQPDADNVSPETIVVATSLTPSEVVHLAHQGIKGIITETCGTKSHTAILARGLALPMVTNLAAACESIPDGIELVLDASRGLVIVNPNDDEQGTVDDILTRLPEVNPAPTPAESRTADGERITLQLNISDPTEADAVPQLGADGIGLFRTEFLYIDRPWWPTEDDNYAIYRDVTERIGDAELNVRLVDFGAEKCPPYADIPMNRNPSLGLRGIRLLLQREDILRPQVRALARLGRERPITVLLPMLDTLDTLETATALLCRLCGCRDRSDLPFKLGTMIEIPAAAFMIEEIIERVDSVSIGLNDLTQYLMAADRDDEFVEQYHEPLQPAVLRIVHHLLQTAARCGKPATICGELAGDPHLSGLLLGLGARRLSVSRSSYPNVVRAITQQSVEAAEALAKQVLRFTSGTAVRQFVKERFTESSTS